ncbi:MAG: MBOAT family protein [Bacteroidetes bacterium]|jgi:alginate O-acetyltransferase complex protein AlgI|nr:MBOAT family protein [Bacteroidota bacterium]
MPFSTSKFLFLFLPLVLLIYFYTKNRYRNIILLIASLIFYTIGEKGLVAVMIASTLIDYKCGHLIESGKKKLGLYLSIFTNLGVLFFFKYFNFGADNLESILGYFSLDTSSFKTLPEIILPLGISFYVFQTMSYSIDVYYGKVKASRNLINFATYVTFFPQLVAGPIVRYQDIQTYLTNRTVNYNDVAIGLERFIIGLAKKVIIANQCAILADSVFDSSISNLSTIHAWLGIIAYTLQIYFDFSGYSDMAIGLGRVFGFRIVENFNYPYISKSIQDFWRRWHISLSTWFRDYLYIPLGGNRKRRYRTYFNLFIVFFVTGLWHGAAWNFVVWGLFHGFFLILERLYLNKVFKHIWSPLLHLYSLMVVILGWVLFRANNFNDAKMFYNKLFLYTEGNLSSNEYINYFGINNEIYFAMVLGVIFSIPIFNLFNKFQVSNSSLYFKHSFLIILFIISLSYVASDSYNPFIYFRF